MFRFKQKHSSAKNMSQSQNPTTPQTSNKEGRPGNLNPGQQHLLNKFRKLVCDGRAL